MKKEMREQWIRGRSSQTIESVIFAFCGQVAFSVRRHFGAFHGLEISHRRISSFGRNLGAQDREWPGNCDCNMLLKCHYLLIFVLIESQHHRIHWVGRGPSGSLSPIPGPSHNTLRVTSLSRCLLNAAKAWCCDHYWPLPSRCFWVSSPVTQLNPNPTQLQVSLVQRISDLGMLPIPRFSSSPVVGIYLRLPSSWSHSSVGEWK